MKPYTVSALKYRPQTFADVIGQDTLVTTLIHSICSKKLAHAYLFSGPRGVGKTTCARIFAKTINCLSPLDNGEACNKCDSCRAFNENRSMNIFELDAASNNSVEDIRLIIEQVTTAPRIGNYKVFIIDEVHMLSQSAFNAFLKTLEEPPRHVVFILATTERQKVPATVLSRCQTYDFHRMSNRDIIDHLQRVAQEEGFDAEEEALTAIAEKADGGMRDALSIFDQVANFSEGKITYAKVVDDLGLIDTSFYFQAVDFILQHDIEKLLLLLNHILSKGIDGRRFNNGLATHLRNLLLAHHQDTLVILDKSDQEKQRLINQAKRLDTKYLYSALKICNRCDLNYQDSRNKRLLVEIMLIELVQTLDNDSPSSGPRPKILKPLFNKEEDKPSPSTPLPSAKSPSAPTSATPVAPKVKIDEKGSNDKIVKNTEKRQVPRMQHSISIFGALNKENEKKVSQNTPSTASPSEHIPQSQPIDLVELKLEWMRYAQSLPVEYAAFSARMSDIEPSLEEDTRVCATVNSELVQQDFEHQRSAIESFLRRQLHNDEITLQIQLIAADCNVKVHYTQREQWAAMIEKNDAFAHLCHALQLELD